MNFLFTLNASYIKPLCVCIKSINSVSDEQNTYFIAHSSLNDKDKSIISECIAGTYHTLHFIKLSDEYFGGMPLLKHITKEAYYRLLCMDYLPENIDRILYLDPDILVINSLRDFYYSDLGSCYLGMASHVDPFLYLFNSARLRLPAIMPYFNSGVMLIDLKKLRKNCTGKKVLDFIKNSKLRFEFGDQDIVNAMFYGRIKEFDAKEINLDLKVCKRSKINHEFVKRNTLIIHYDGKDKPWNDGCKNPLKVFYEEFSNDKEAFPIH